MKVPLFLVACNFISVATCGNQHCAFFLQVRLDQGIIGREKGYYTEGAELVDSVGCGSKTGREL